MMLAEISAGEEWMLIATLVMAAATIGALIVSIIALNRKQEVKVDQPLEVRFAEEFVHRTTFTEHQRDVADGFKSVERKFVEAHKERAEDLRLSALSRKGIYDKIDLTRGELSQKQEDIRRELSDKIGDMPAQIVTLLKQTGAIK